MSENRVVWPVAVVQAIESAPPEAFPRVSYSEGPDGVIRIAVFLEGQQTCRALTIRPCPSDPLSAELVLDETARVQIVSCDDPKKVQRAIHRAILECVPESFDDQFAQLMVDLRGSESLEELQRQLRSLADPAARTIIEQLMVLREAVELLHRTNEVLLLFAAFLASKDRSAFEEGC